MRGLSCRIDYIVQTFVHRLYRGRGRVVCCGRGRMYGFFPWYEL